MTLQRETELQHNKLPDNETIRSRKKGFPPIQEEKGLRDVFLGEYRQKSVTYLANHVPGWQYSEAQGQRFLHFLYGIYLTNYIFAGTIIDRDAHPIMYSRANKNHGSDEKGLTKQLDVRNLEDWPIRLYVGTSPSESKLLPSSQSRPGVSQFGELAVPVSWFEDKDPNKRETVLVSSRKILGVTVPKLTYKSTIAERDVLTGVEEAHHIWRCFREHRAKKGEAPQLTHEELVNDRRAADLEIMYLDNEKGLTYHSVFGSEYSALLFQAQIVKRYMPELWHNGYEKFVQEVISRRRKRQKVHLQ